MSARQHRSTFTRTEHMLAGADHGLRYLTAADGETFTPGHTLTVDGDGNIADSGSAPGSSAFRIRDGLAIEYDPTPSSPNTEDDEFNSSSLDGKWSVVTNTASSVDIDTTWASHIYVQFTGNQEYRIRQSFSPAGDFSITARITYALQGNFQGPRIEAFDDDGSDSVGASWDGASANGTIFRKDSGSYTFGVAVLSRAAFDKVYLHLQRVGTTWRAGDQRPRIAHQSHRAAQAC